MAYEVANQALPGLMPYKNQAGTAPQIHPYTVAAAYTGVIGEGCLLIKTATGANLAGAAVAAGAVIGVAAHNVLSTGADRTVHVYDDPNQQFVCISNGTMTTTVAEEMISQFVQPLTNAYNGTLSQGNVVLDISTLTSVHTTTVALQIMGVPDAIGETIASTYCQVIVRVHPRDHMWATQSGTNTTPST